MLFNINSKKSFLEIKHNMKINHKKNMFELLVGNKRDLGSEREVSTKEAQELADYFGI